MSGVRSLFSTLYNTDSFLASRQTESFSLALFFFTPVSLTHSLSLSLAIFRFPFSLSLSLRPRPQARPLSSPPANRVIFSRKLKLLAPQPAAATVRTQSVAGPPDAAPGAKQFFLHHPHSAHTAAKAAAAAPFLFRHFMKWFLIMRFSFVSHSFHLRRLSHLSSPPPKPPRIENELHAVYHTQYRLFL